MILDCVTGPIVSRCRMATKRQVNAVGGLGYCLLLIVIAGLLGKVESTFRDIPNSSKTSFMRPTSRIIVPHPSVDHEKLPFMRDGFLLLFGDYERTYGAQQSSMVSRYDCSWGGFIGGINSWTLQRQSFINQKTRCHIYIERGSIYALDTDVHYWLPNQSWYSNAMIEDGSYRMPESEPHAGYKYGWGFTRWRYFQYCLLNLEYHNQQQTEYASEPKPQSRNPIAAVPSAYSYTAEQYAADYGKPEDSEIHLFTLHVSKVIFWDFSLAGVSGFCWV
jgi:hypothetical protein